MVPLVKSGDGTVCLFASIPMAGTRATAKELEFPTLWLGVRIGTTFTSGTRSQTSFGPTTTIHRPVQFLTNMLFSKASAAGYLTARPSIRKAIFGIAGSNGNCIVGVTPDGKIDRLVEMPVKNITTCTFGGTDLKTLFVTTASAEAPPGDRLAGSLFSIQTNVTGQPENQFCFYGHRK